MPYDRPCPPRRAPHPEPRDAQGPHYREQVFDHFNDAEKDSTVILTGGLSRSADILVAAALRGAGYRARAFPVPDRRALEVGKEFCGRGQCNPAYFMIGNLVRYLQTLRDEQGLSPAQINRDYVFMTAAACGPCRFGSYITEYRRALREAGFEGFRVILLEQKAGAKQACGSGHGIVLDRRLSLGIVSAMIAADVLNLIGYRTRPYETVPGATDAALDRCRTIVETALARRTSLRAALRRCQPLLAGVAVNRSQPRPRAALIGEFWAITTEGDGNYGLQRFLEDEGAEVEVQPLSVWLLYLVWQGQWDTRRRIDLPGRDGGRQGLAGKRPRIRLIRLWAAERLIRLVFRRLARAAGLRGYALPDMGRLARLAQAHYSPELRGGEGHLEVAKLIDAAERGDCDLVISVKPFGCLPSSGVSDGVQARVRALHPSVIFLSVETTGDAAANVYSRVQMAVFKARAQMAARQGRSAPVRG
ncbi:2-hydroxyglutaryl-CoA dehydratase [Rhodovulum adriaticum]|uniref:Putative nucleotide-binding protein (Sugar kinase/HSP70/actin superfamily) n=1 Tax=Rhodovulum adriaticum TaxID=35804 RepID=A0A4R2NIK1_RHOAD|nr:2-hydroxyglutaryl-CoA dehydratase [Rhodovulum adriaticum]MBK1635412.1 hypothetical protein [Rhodovulum adriaticum]TCP21118.1 putative nucleotide-binding protein (sugar kinase/HSP70/actin superfamily) [Rhodovulum adriaticum]